MGEILANILFIVLGLLIVLFAHKFNAQHDKFWSKATSKSEESVKQFRSSTTFMRVVGGVAAGFGLILLLTNLLG